MLLFFPGVLCALVVHSLTIKRERTTPQFLTSAFVYGVSTYLLLAGLRETYAAAAAGRARSAVRTREVQQGRPQSRAADATPLHPSSTLGAAGLVHASG